jgi:hypothetical protein
MTSLCYQDPGLPGVLRHSVKLRTSTWVAYSTESRDADGKPEEKEEKTYYSSCDASGDQVH